MCDLSLKHSLTLLKLFSQFLLNRNQPVIVGRLNETITWVEGCRHFVYKLTPHLHRFDFSEEVQYNGYRTFITLTKITAVKCLYLVDDINHLGRLFIGEQSHPILYE